MVNRRESTADNTNTSYSNTKAGAREMASLVKGLPGKHEELSSNPSSHPKACTVVHTHSSAGEWKEGEYLGVAGQDRLAESVSSRFSERLKKNIQQKASSKDKY